MEESRHEKGQRTIERMRRENKRWEERGRGKDRCKRRAEEGHFEVGKGKDEGREWR